MSRSQLIWPFTLLAAFALMALLLAVAGAPTPLAAQDPCATAHPTDSEARTRCYEDVALQPAARNPQGYPYPYNPPTNTPLPENTSPPVTDTPTPTATLDASRTPPTATPTGTPTATRQPAASPIPTATSTLVGLETILCAPGSTVTITGSAAPSQPLLLYFNNRPVGGGLARPDGLYALLLRVGRERPGLYPLEIRERDSRAIIRSLACDVPGATPTPTQPVTP